MTDNTDKVTEATLRVSNAFTELAADLTVRGIDKRIVTSGLMTAAIEAYIDMLGQEQAGAMLARTAMNMQADAASSKNLN